MGRKIVERRRAFPEHVPSRIRRAKLSLRLSGKRGVLAEPRAVRGVKMPQPEDRVPEKAREMQDKIYSLLFVRDDLKTKPEVLTVVVRRDKARFFEFLKAYTKWQSVGKWEEDVEGNVVIKVVFYDYENDAVGRELEKALKRYNDLAVKEEELAFWTEPVSETSIPPPDEEGPVPEELKPYRRSLAAHA